MSWRDAASQALGPAAIADINKYLVQTNPATSGALDRFYTGSSELLKIGTPAFLAANAAMGPLLLVGFVSITENYFRDAFAGILRLCPMARARAADQSVKLGSVVWHGAANVERGAFEHVSFADGDTLQSVSMKFLGYPLQKTAVVEEFDRVCELRHGIVHSSAVLAAKNAVRLKVASSVEETRIVVGFPELQECAAVCTALVVSANRELFVEMTRRWVKAWPYTAGWDPTKRHSLFKDIWSIFHSSIDADRGLVASPLSLLRCRNEAAKDPF